MHAEAPTFTAQIYIGGDICEAERVCRRFCMDRGLCVTLEPVNFVFTGGSEWGVRVGLINYPRFPATEDVISSLARSLAEELRAVLCQHSYSIVTPTFTRYDSTRDEHPLEHVRAQA